MQRRQKEALVKMLGDEIGKSRTVAVMPLAGMPDRLLQNVRNNLRGSAKIIVTRKTLAERAVGAKISGLSEYLQGNFAIVLSNDSPFDLFKKMRSYKLALLAKPGQTAPSDILVKAGETDVAPGQAVTELKLAGLDVQIQKNKVVIAKDKVVAEAGKRISPGVANALKLLGVKPFSVGATVSVAYADGLLFSTQALSIDEEFVKAEIAKSFAEANVLSTGIGYITVYNAGYFVTKAYAEAMALGVAAKVPEPEVLERLVADATAAANKINNVLSQNSSADAGSGAGQAQGSAESNTKS
ncbi:MAG: 50S ribosomal protein L10 [Candidatus Micrarchaeia archaeon]